MKAALPSLAVYALSIAIHAAFTAGAMAAEPPAVRSPVAPQESLAHFVVAPGLKIELVAHEPNVIDPVAIRFDELSRMWAVEMRDYPTGTPGKRGGSRISVLEDADNDGFYETSVVFAENLPFATGIQPWKGGVFVTMAGRVAYLKDTTGDGKADVDETWYTGFAEENTQLRANHPTLALDNHIYIANGLRGGAIVDASRPDAKPVSISGMDFRFDPLMRKFEAVSGAGQFGLAFDDYGNRFVCTNRNPAIHIVLEDRYLKKNPLVAVASVSHDVAKAGDESRVFPIGRAWTTSNLHAGQFTAACGLEIYRGDALPAEFYGNVFVCEPTGHLVHREIMKPHGVTFTSKPAYEGKEFLASRDEWFSPVSLEVGPDGAVYVVDMYRAVIEHPDWMPEELRKRPDLLWGNDRGRIYRVVPQDFRRPAPPHLSSMPSARLVELLAHPNAWWRETAARLLLERQDKTVARALQTMALSHNSVLARIHALRLLQGFHLVSDGLLGRMLQDSNPRVLEQVLCVAESHLATGGQAPGLVARIDLRDDARLRFQTLLSGMSLPWPPKLPTDSWEQAAMLLAARDQAGTVLSDMLQHQPLLDANVEHPKRFVADLARLAATLWHDKEQTSAALDALFSNDTYRRVGLASFLKETQRQHGSLKSVRKRLDNAARDSLDQAFDAARRDAADSNLPVEVRSEAIDLLRASADSVALLAGIALGDQNPAIRARAITALPVGSGLDTWRRLLRDFSQETPALQAAILQGLLADRHRASLLLDELVAGSIKPASLGASRVNQLLKHRDAEIRRRAETIFAEALPADREQALADYERVLNMPADPAHGRAVFRKHCANCHRVENFGVNVAPDISDTREKSPKQLLTDIIQPNRAIDSNYFSYTAVATDGRVYTGILTAETSTSVALKEAEGRIVTLRRSEIDELHSNGISLMPDGLEKLIPPQEMADLISFLKNWRYLDRSAGAPLPPGLDRAERTPD
jgi:putative membrane-bound dehydrogenase-like protein